MHCISNAHRQQTAEGVKIRAVYRTTPAPNNPDETAVHHQTAAGVLGVNKGALLAMASLTLMWFVACSVACNQSHSLLHPLRLETYRHDHSNGGL